MKYIDAMRVAQKLIAAMKPHCERIEIAGSLRRQKDEVKDIEIVAIPKRPKLPKVMPQAELFGGADDLFVEGNALHEWATTQKMIQWIKPATSDIEKWEVKPDGKYWHGLIDCWNLGGPFTERVQREIKLDLFLCRPENWSVIYLIRTGSADFSTRFVTHVRDNTDYIVHDGQVWRKADGAMAQCPEERDLFALVGAEYVTPRLRKSGSDLRVVQPWI